MAFSTLTFITLFLPFSVLLYYLPLWRRRALEKGPLFILILTGLLFYAWGEPLRVFGLFISIVLNFVLLRVWFRLNQRRAGDAKRHFSFETLLWVSGVVLNLAYLGAAKYWFESLPLGISFYTFRILSAYFDLRREAQGKEGVKRPCFLDFCLYISFFPQLMSGPISQYGQFISQISRIKAKLDFLSSGLWRFFRGLFIKVLLADSLWPLREQLLASAGGAVDAWLAALLYAFYIFLDFSSYSDMAIGLSLIFGFETPENFDRPYNAISITDFWRRWHRSLSFWFRDYVYIPLGGNRRGYARQCLNILLVWGLTGIWHGSSLNFLLWGLYYGVILLLEKTFLLRLAEHLPLLLRRFITFGVVVMGWVLFAAPDLGQLQEILRALFGFNGAGGRMSLYLLLNHSVILLTGTFFAFSLDQLLWKRFKTTTLYTRPLPRILGYLSVCLLACLTTAFLLDQSFSSFLYFNF